MVKHRGGGSNLAKVTSAALCRRKLYANRQFSKIPKCGTFGLILPHYGTQGQPMPILRDGKPFVIYALVCPLSLEVKYVGQTVDLEQRTRGKTHNTRGHTRLTEWLQTLGYLRPYKVILEKGINRRVELPAPPRLGRGRRPL